MPGDDQKTMSGQQLRLGDVVVVRPPAEILASLDGSGALDALPFMPEMLQFIGRRFTVTERVDKICDTVGPGGSRRMRDTVFLEDLRCDGSAHGGCQAECRIYWKEAWLARVGTISAAENDLVVSPAVQALDHLLGRNTRPQVSSERAEAEFFRCQATEALRATELIASQVSPAQYIRELSSGNVTRARFVRVALRAVFWKLGSLLGLNVGSLLRAPYFRGPSGKPDNPESLRSAAGRLGRGQVGGGDRPDAEHTGKKPGHALFAG